VTAENIGRRKLIKRAAAVGGVVWAAPVIESMVHAAAGTPPPTTAPPTTAPPTTAPFVPCDSTICSKAVLPSGTVYFVGEPTNGDADRDCLCQCADPNFGGQCSADPPCSYEVTFTACPDVNVCCCPPDLCPS
jgi:hypothetical protein